MAQKVGYVIHNDKLYSADMLAVLAKHKKLPVKKCNPTDHAGVLAMPTWETPDRKDLTPLEVLEHPDDHPEHFVRIGKADLKHPILIAPDGSILDGYHRLAKAVATSVPTIKCIQLTPQILKLALLGDASDEEVFYGTTVIDLMQQLVKALR